jgi:transposase
VKIEDPRLLPKSLFGSAVAYTLKRWDTLSCFTQDPGLAIDSNAVEREIRPVALGKKNWLFCASEVGAEASAIIYSLIASCRLANIDPFDNSPMSLRESPFTQLQKSLS